MTTPRDSVTSTGETKSIDDTQIDLGSDLLHVPDFTHTETTQRQLELETATELLKNAQILFSESFLEDSKSTLRKVLIMDPSNVQALQLLEQIHQLELRRLLGDQETRRAYGVSADPIQDREDPEDVIAKLDNDLELGLLTEGTLSNEEIDRIFKSFKESLVPAELQDWTDLAIAFLEMEQSPVAIKILVYCRNTIDPKAKADQLVVTGLLAQAYLMRRQPLQMLEVIHETIRDDEIPTEEKIDLFYLMGRAYEIMKKKDVALHFYRQVSHLNKNYRDVESKFSKQFREND